MTEEIFKKDAKSIVDMCFESKLFNDQVTRDTMTNFEDLISFMLQSRFESYQKIEELLLRAENLKQSKQIKKTEVFLTVDKHSRVVFGAFFDGEKADGYADRSPNIRVERVQVIY